MPWFNQGLWCGVGKHHFCWGTVQVEFSNSVSVPPSHFGQVVQVPTWCSVSLIPLMLFMLWQMLESFILTSTANGHITEHLITSSTNFTSSTSMSRMVQMDYLDSVPVMLKSFHPLYDVW
jgi:hypothetical protein